MTDNRLYICSGIKNGYKCSAGTNGSSDCYAKRPYKYNSEKYHSITFKGNCDNIIGQDGTIETNAVLFNNGNVTILESGEIQYEQ